MKSLCSSLSSNETVGPAAATRGPGWASKGGRGQESGEAKGAGAFKK